MKATISVILLIICLILNVNCRYSNIQNKSNPIFYDTLKIPYLDTKIIGFHLFPHQLNFNEFSNFKEKNILSIFQSGNYYYIFYNKAEIDFLSDKYWSKQISIYLTQNYYLTNSELKLKRVEYNEGPYLTGFYSKMDSILVHTNDIKHFEKDKSTIIYVNYFSTRNPKFEIKNISIGSDINDVLTEIQVPENVKIHRNNEPLYIVTMLATNKIENVWFASYPNLCNDDTNAIVFKFVSKKLVQIEYCDFEVAEHVFKKENIYMRDIHY